MADIELVIKIPEEDLEAIEKLKSKGWASRHELSILNGIRLPKGHGKLIDADELKKHKYHDNHRYENAVAVAYIDWADAIIESDKED